MLISTTAMMNVILPLAVGAVMNRSWALTLPLLRRPQGVYACENNQTQNTELKAWGGYKYAIRSDYGATHSTVPSALHGLDQEFPGAHIKVVVSAAAAAPV